MSYVETVYFTNSRIASSAKTQPVIWTGSHFALSATSAPVIMI